jgi:hypothetical protein
MLKAEARGVVLALLLVSGCGSSEGGGGGGGSTGSVCIPGASVSCACTNGGEGAQVCNASGSGFGICSCMGATGFAGTTGSAGATGGAGTSGTTGTGGAAGTAGVAGTTGTAGSAAGGSAGGRAGGSGGAGGATGGAGRGGSGGATGSAGTTGTGGYTGRLVSVIITDSIIAPGMADGTDWDGIGNVDPDVVAAVATALAAPVPAVEVLKVLTGPLLLDVDKPDPYGDAYVTAFGIPGGVGDLASMASPDPNTFHPIWPANWFFPNVPIDSDVRVTVELWDSDLLYPDSIEAVQLNADDLKAALAAQQAVEVRVDDQGQHQLLFVGISVTQQTGPL